MILTPKDTRRFWSHVDKSPGHGPQGQCWIWTGANRGNGYGCIKIAGKLFSTHRLSLILVEGDRPGLVACHECDHRPCVRPDHLFWGTSADNMRDCAAKGRLAIRAGEEAPSAKLDAARVALIRSMARDGFGCRELGRRFAVDDATIRKIVSRQTWRHVA
jgi:hypothetical protein